MRKLALIALFALAACAAKPPQQATLDIEQFVTPATKEFAFRSNGPETVAVRWRGQVVKLVRPGESVKVELKP